MSTTHLPDVEPRGADASISDPAVADTGRFPGHPREQHTPISTDPLSGISRIGEDAVDIQVTPTSQLMGLESTSLADGLDIVKSTPSAAMLELEPTSLVEDPPSPIHRSSMPTHVVQDEPVPEERSRVDHSGGRRAGARGTRRAVSRVRAGHTHNASGNAAAGGTADAPTPQTTQAALDGLPLMDLDVPAAPTPRRCRARDSLRRSTNWRCPMTSALIEDSIDEPLADLADEPVAPPVNVTILAPVDTPRDAAAQTTVDELTKSMRRSTSRSPTSQLPERWTRRRRSSISTPRA